METLSLSAFSQEILDRSRLPLNGTLELTFRCNLKCGFCYRPGNADTSGPAELDTAEIERIVREIADAGCLTLLLTGGEPLLRRDFNALYALIRQQGIFVTLFTNGTLVNEAVADRLCEYPPKKVEVSLYGATRATYERITGIPGSHAACLRGIERLRSRNLPLVLKTTVSRGNVHELPEMAGFARQIGVDFKWDPMLDPRTDGGQEPCSHRLAPAQIVELDRRDPERMAGFRRLCRRGPQTVDRGLVYICGAGEGSFHIDPRGRMSPCSMTRYASYDLRRGTFAEGFYSHFPRLRAQRFAAGEVPPCAECGLINLCTNCPGTAFLENGRLHKPSPFHCEVARLRSREAESPPTMALSPGEVRAG